MLEILNETVSKSPELVETEHPNSKYILLNYGDIQKSNFIENNIVIRFYVDEFTMACESDIEFKPVMDYLTQIVNT